VTGEPVRAALEEAQARVAVMKNSYRRMYQDQSVEHVRLPGFVETLVAEIEQSYGAYRDVRVEREVEDIAIASRAAFPFGIIVNELLTNAYKYAFDDDAGACITISVQPDEDDALRVVVSDNGIGFEESRRGRTEGNRDHPCTGCAYGSGEASASGEAASGEPGSGESASGLNLVRELAAQYGGSLRIDDRAGTVAEVTLGGVCAPSAQTPERRRTTAEHGQ
jgi:two-component sensor histidine kinase